MKNLYRMRVQLRPESGALGRLGRALEYLQGSIITIDLQDLDDARAVDDVIVEFAAEVPSLSEVSAALERFDGGTLCHWAPATEALDPVLRSIRWACSIYAAGATSSADEVVRVMGEICGTVDTWLFDATSDQNIAASMAARRSHSPVALHTDDVSADLPVSFTGGGWVLAVPDACLAPDRVAVLARPSKQPFSATEIERVQAILAVYRQAKHMVATPRITTLPDGPWLDVSAG